MKILVMAAVMAGLHASAAVAEVSNASEVIAAERAFAVDGAAMGVKGSFLKHSAPDAIVFRPGPVNAQDFYKARPDRTHPPLEWWPIFAGIARSGDLGFTTGPATFGGEPSSYYFTVWKRQPDGGWKWVYDGGGDPGPAPLPPNTTPVTEAPVSGERSASPGAAMAEVAAAEARLAKAAAADAKAAYAPVLAAEARLMGRPAGQATDAAGREAEFAWRGAAMTFAQKGGEASKAGDFAWTWGEAAWSAGAQKGHYVRVWQKRPAGWMIVFEHLNATPAS